MASESRQFGDAGEEIAARYLMSLGHKLIERNYHKKYGEIDIISTTGKRYIFTEVKTRDKQSPNVFLPEDSVNYAKARKLRRICQIYLSEHNLFPEEGWQIDVIAVTIDKIEKSAKIRHIENAIGDIR